MRMILAAVSVSHWHMANYTRTVSSNFLKNHTKVCGCIEKGPAKPPQRAPKSPPCLPNYFDKVSKEVTERKKYCDIGNSDNPSFREGSWGDCQKALQSAVQYVIGGTNNCQDDDDGETISFTTVAPSARRMRLNQQFMKFAGM